MNSTITPGAKFTKLKDNEPQIDMIQQMSTAEMSFDSDSSKGSFGNMENLRKTIANTT